MNLLVFANDRLDSYIKKGELKVRYFNPNNIFKNIYFIDFTNSPIDLTDIKITTGQAAVKIFNLPQINIKDSFFPKKRLNSIFETIENLDIDIVRGYSATFSGFYAKEAAKYKSVPSLISLHTNFNDMRFQFLKRKDYLRWAKYFISKYTLERSTLSEVTHIIAAYNFTKKYAIDMGIDEKRVDVVYNKVFFDKFFPSENFRNEKEIKVISVGNLEIGKGQRVLVDAMSKMSENISLTLVGDGEDHEMLKSKVKKYGLEKRVVFIKSIPNLELAKLYREHDMFSLPIQYGGICIPALEATASGLALVMPKPIHEESPEITGEYAEVVENTSDGFAKGIQKVADDAVLRKRMREKGLKVIKNYSGDIMETKESEIYKSMIKKWIA